MPLRLKSIKFIKKLCTFAFNQPKIKTKNRTIIYNEDRFMKSKIHEYHKKMKI